MRSALSCVLLLTLLSTACGPGIDRSSDEPSPTVRGGKIVGPLDDGVRTNLDAIFSAPTALTKGSVRAAGTSQDLRVAWPLVELLRFHQAEEQGPEIQAALERLTGVAFGEGAEEETLAAETPWVGYTDLLLREDIHAPPGYLGWKRSLFTAVDARWAPFFVPDADLDWREVSWGGVLRDGIPALVDPPVVPATEGDWLPDDDLVFGLVVNGDARAYPKRILDLHEMVNDTLGGRRIAMPYCTLCRSATPYLVDRVEGVDEALELRTSGLLQRSNKLAYDVQTESLWDQFSATAVTGPLRGRTLPTLPVTVTTWGEWRTAHPRTTLLPSEIDGIPYGAHGPDPLGDRDGDGPIFPVGDVDPRLETLDLVYGVRTPRGEAVAFPVPEARNALRNNRPVEMLGVELRLDAGGLRAYTTPEGVALSGHEAYWFAWSQFHPATRLWSP